MGSLVVLRYSNSSHSIFVRVTKIHIDHKLDDSVRRRQNVTKMYL